MTDAVTAGVLVLAGTPIGDPTDASPRLVAELATADLVAAEDTRRLSRLTAALGVKISGRVVSYHEHNEAARTGDLVEAVRGGARVLVTAVVAAGLPVTAVPGPSAVLTALALSGLPVDRFCFEGFLPRKAGERARALAGLAAEPRTMVFFEAPHRLSLTLAAMSEAFGAERLAAVCRELTKTYEEVRRGPLAGLVTWAAGEVRGEITVVVAGAPVVTADPATALAAVQARVVAGERLKDAVAAVAGPAGLPKRELYAAALAARAVDLERP
jgi:16S rRNA (cytidine1402-2'-O)-methyltransferase